MRKKIAEFIATVCYIGKIKYAPGTFGSLPAFPLCYIIMHFTLNNKIVFPIKGFAIAEQQILTLFFIELMATFILFIIGTYFTAIYIADLPDKDPKEVVIDEVVGQMLVVILCSFSVVFAFGTTLPEHLDARIIDFIFLFLSPFVLFRLFDIKKPWPINWLDRKIKGAFGVMVDDIGAAIFAIIAHYALVFIILDFYAK
jgi:phosphatidylglycerophosphatase A